MAEESTNKPTSRRTERIGRYEIVGHIATGGMGVIYKARDIDLDRTVALKILPPDMAAQQMTLIRFQREARAAAQLRHENIVSIFDVGEANGTYYIALEYVEGTDLQDYINRHCRLHPDEVRQIMIQAAKALVHAHEQGIVHRDIKPSNFLLTHKGDRLIVKLTDFGLAIRGDNDAEFRITKDKTTVGTVDYMSPEQARDSRSVDIRSDIYSLGCTAYHMLAGLAPFGRGTLPERIIQHMKSPPPDVRKLTKGVPEYLIAVINKMLAKKPGDRYQTPAELLYDLEHPEKVLVPAKRDGKPGRSKRKPAGDMTQEIDNEELRDTVAERAPIKISRPKKTPTELPIDDEPDLEPEPEPEPEAPAPRQIKSVRVKKPTPYEEEADEEEAPDQHYDEPADRDEPAETDGEESSAALESSEPSLPGKKWSAPIGLIVAAGAVGVLVLVLVIAVAFGGRTPAPTPPTPDPPPDRGQHFVEAPIEKKDDDKPPPPPRIDTSAAKMGIGALGLPTMELDKVDPAALRKEYFGAFTAFPAPPADARVLQVSRLIAPGPTLFRTLADAFSATRPEETVVIDIYDNGPIFVPQLPALTQRTIFLRGMEGYRPLVVWDMPSKPAKGGPTFCSLGQGKLVVDNLDFVMRYSDDAPATIFDLPDSDFHSRDCTFSIAGKSKEAVALVRRRGPGQADKRSVQTWLKRCYVRGSSAALLHLREASTDVMLQDSLVVGYQHPLIDMRGREADALALHCVRSTLVAGQVLLRWQSPGDQGVQPPIACRMLDSILSCDDATAAQGDMIKLADGAGPQRMEWRAANVVYAGWKNLLASDGKTIEGSELERWHDQWSYRRGDRTVGDPWPLNPPSALDEQPADTFLPSRLEVKAGIHTLAPVAFAALSEEGAIGAAIGRLPPAPETWLERTFEPRAVPVVSAVDETPRIDTAVDGFYHGERIDVAKVPDLGAYLNAVLKKARPASHVVIHVAGKGAHPTSTLRIAGVSHFTLFFERDLKDPLTLEANPATSFQRAPLIEMTGGHLEVIGGRFRLSPTTTVPTALQVIDGDLTLTRCWLQGPHAKVTDSFLSLVTVSNAGPVPSTLVVRDSVLVASKLLIQMHDQVQLKARNNVLLALGDGVRHDAKALAVPLVHVLDHNTWAVRQTFFDTRFETLQGPGSTLVYASSNAFLHPFDDADKATLLRGIVIPTALGRWSWQGRYNVYDSRLHAYFAGNEKTPGPRQTRQDWQIAWGQPGERDGMLFTDAKATRLTVDAMTQAAVLQQLDRLGLPPELRGDRNQPPPGADLVGLGIKKKG
jgi:serine/threonine-protein kinase